MSKKDKKVLQKVLSGLSDKSIKFSDLRELVRSLGFDERTKGDHYIFTMAVISEIINLQPLKDGRAKVYQAKQVRSIILKYKLHEEANDV
ncbi:MAG: type II toxin-antitoxin system HicA family toxin [Chloroflexota bacterium]